MLAYLTIAGVFFAIGFILGCIANAHDPEPRSAYGPVPFTPAGAERIERLAADAMHQGDLVAERAARRGVKP